MTTAAPPHTGSSRLLRQLEEDADLSAGELVDVLAHCAAVSASADYRMLQAVSLIHEERAELYGAALADAFGWEPAADRADFRAESLRHARVQEELGPDGLEQTIATVGATLTVPPARARRLIIAGDTMRFLLPQTGGTLAFGRIDLQRFLIVVDRTRLCAEEIFPRLDKELALEIGNRAPMSPARFRMMVDAVVARVDPDASRRHLIEGEAGRHITIRPDRGALGQSRISGSLPADRAARLDSRLDAMAEAVHAADPRTGRQRRADALVALASGQQYLSCECPACLPLPEPADGDERPGPSAPAGDGCPRPSAPADERPRPSTHTGDSSPEPAHPTAPPQDVLRPKPVFHIVVNLSTLLGVDDLPGFLDGHGVIAAAVARELLAEARRSYVHTPHTGGTGGSAVVGSGYAPPPSIRSLVTAGEVCCTFPGCDTSVRRCDLDHTIPHRDGGETSSRNLKPLCRFHHRIKTFDPGWRDYQGPLGTVFFQSPTGHLFHGNAFTGYDLFAGLRCPPTEPSHPVRRHLTGLRSGRRREHLRARARYDAAHPPPF